MTKPRVPGSQQELYTVSVESMPQYKSRCCQRERLCKDLLCVTLIALAVVCLAVAIFLIVFFLASDPKSGSLARTSNDTAESSKFERQREEETNVNKIDNPRTEVVDIHHHDEDEEHDDHDHKHEEKKSPEYNVSLGSDVKNPNPEPQPEPEPEPKPEPQPAIPHQKPEPLPVTETPAVTANGTTGLVTESTLPDTNFTKPVSQNADQSTQSPQTVIQSTTTAPVNVSQSTTVSPKSIQSTPASGSTSTENPQPPPGSDKWSVVNVTDPESKADEHRAGSDLQPNTTRTDSTSNVTVTETPVILVPEFDNSPWKPIPVPQPDQNQGVDKGETVTSSVTDKTKTDPSTITPTSKPEEQTIKISLEDAVPVIPDDGFLPNSTAAETETPEITTEIIPKTVLLNETREPLVSTASPVNLPTVTEKDRCIRRSVPLCRGILPYPETKLPNWIGDNTEVERNLTLPFIEAIVNSDCSPRVQQYACAVLEPPCSSGVALPPCRKFCQAIAEDCKQYVLSALNLAKVFDCNQFPDSIDPDVCVNLAASSDEGECLDGEFHCGDNTCIPENWVCDGKKDCSGGDDEFTCVACREGEFRCEVGNRCVPNTWRCDGSPDCKDGSDERNCNPSGECPEGQFRCEDGLSCIPKRWVCDGSNHCRDNSDETNCTAIVCQNDDFKCRESGLCIPRIWVCDSNWDCKDGSDEESCIVNNADKNAELIEELRIAESASNTTAADPDICPLGEIFCIAGRRCIRIDQLCDGQEDCADGADEKDCKQS